MAALNKPANNKPQLFLHFHTSKIKELDVVFQQDLLRLLKIEGLRGQSVSGRMHKSCKYEALGWITIGDLSEPGSLMAVYLLQGHIVSPKVYFWVKQLQDTCILQNVVWKNNLTD